jgi:hypothetical protein
MAGPVHWGSTGDLERIKMKDKRHLAIARRVMVTSVSAFGLIVGLAAGAPSAHADVSGPTPVLPCGAACVPLPLACTWAPITLVNSWQSEDATYATGDPSVCVESDGMVYLAGSVGTHAGTSREFGVLPQNAWPAHVIYLNVYTYNLTHGVLVINPDGTMYAYDGTGWATSYTSLAGVSFQAAPTSPAQWPVNLSLRNGWQSAQGIYNTGDPAYYISGHIVHLSGSLQNPNGTGDNPAVTMPSQTQPDDSCWTIAPYTYGGGVGSLAVDALTESFLWAGAETRYVSLAAINYPDSTAQWHSLTFLAGTGSEYCSTPPSYYISGSVVYLTGDLSLPDGFNGEIFVLPPGARPSHVLWMTYNGDGTLKINPDGSVYVYGSEDYMYLSAMSFHLGS